MVKASGFDAGECMGGEGGRMKGEGGRMEDKRACSDDREGGARGANAMSVFSGVLGVAAIGFAGGVGLLPMGQPGSLSGLMTARPSRMDWPLPDGCALSARAARTLEALKIVSIRQQKKRIFTLTIDVAQKVREWAYNV